MMKRLPMEARTVFALCVMQILFKIVFEYEGAQKAAAMGIGAPAHVSLFVIVIGVVWAVFTIWSLFYQKIAYLFIIGFAAINLFPLILVWFGKTPYIGRPFFNGWMTLCLIYFAYQSYKHHKTQATPQGAQTSPFGI
jgi:hypothetical protein